MTFLEKAADHIFQRHRTHMDDVWVVLPTRRAVAVFQQQLSQHAETPFMAPHVVAVDDFITTSAGVQLIDPVSLLFELYEVFRQADESLEFSRFLNWATVLLADFDRIDQYLISPSELFSYLTAAKSLERWQLDLPTGYTPKLETSGTQRYFKLFENLETVYQALHERLLSKGLAYRGMAYRLLAESVGDRVLGNPAYEKLYFVGFNALSKSEEHIARTLIKAQKAEMLWDTDAYYMESKRQEAGKMLRRYKEEGWSGPWTWEETQLTESPKNIQVIGVPNASMQAKVAGHLYRQWQAESGLPDGAGPAETTALVLGDETLLLPVLYSLGGAASDLNVTMGLSLRNSLLFTLIDALFEMQRTVVEFARKDGSGTVRVPKYNHRHVVKVLSHPFIRQYEQDIMCAPDAVSADFALAPAGHTLNADWSLFPESVVQPGAASDAGPATRIIRETINAITADNLVYLDEKQLLTLGQDCTLFRVLFKRWPDDKPLVVIRQFYALIDLLREVYARKPDAIEIEYLFLFQNLLRQLETTLEREERNELVTIKNLKQFLYELIRQTSIPFESEGGSSLQVMGMLETRALDFDRLILLSVNEGVLPQSRKMNSLIPFDAATAVGLPTYQEQESVMSYHFYRLLQRAKEVVLLYVTSPDAYGTSKGEKSRFILQLEHELQPTSRGNISLHYPMVRFGAVEPIDEKLPMPSFEEFEIPKSEAILNEIKRQLTGRYDPQRDRTFGGLSPTQMNNFLSCSLKFYFSRVIKLEDDDEVADGMDAAEFGEWIHFTLEKLDQKYRMKGQEVVAETVVAELKAQYEELFRNRVIDSGMNRLLYRIGEDLMVRFNDLQQQRYAGLEVLQTEEEWETTLLVETAMGPVSARIAGKIDRVERLHQPGGPAFIRVADYKTGRVEAKDADVTKLEDLLTDPKYDKARQLWLYQYLVYKKMLQRGGLQFDNQWIEGTDTSVVAGFYSFRNLDAGFIENKVRLGSPQEYVTRTEDFLQQLLKDLFDPTKPFQKTEDKKVCDRCDYRKLCGR